MTRRSSSASGTRGRPRISKSHVRRTSPSRSTTTPLHTGTSAPLTTATAGWLRDAMVDGEERTTNGLPPGGTLPLCGRGRECAELDELIAAVRRGESRALVLRGDAGIGKTALLEYLVSAASDLTVIRAVGVESEMELAYAG